MAASNVRYGNGVTAEVGMVSCLFNLFVDLIFFAFTMYCANSKCSLTFSSKIRLL